MHPAAILFGQPQQVRVLDAVDELIDVTRGQTLLEPVANGIHIRPAVVKLLADLLAQTARRPAQMGLEDLSHVHPRGDSQRIEHDVHGGPILQIGHVLFRQNTGDDALVSVPPRHLVADLEFTLDRDKDLHHLDHSRRQFVSALELVHLVLEDQLDQIDLLRGALHDPLELRVHGFIIDPDLSPIGHGDLLEILFGDLLALVEKHLAVVIAHPCGRAPAHEEFFQPLEGSLLDDADLLLLILLEARDLLVLDDPTPLVLGQSLAREDPHIDDGPLDSRRHPERGVPNLPCLLSENSSEKLFFGRELGFSLRGDLAHQDISGLDLRPDADDAALIQFRQRLVADVGNIPGDLLWTELGVARDALELLYVDGGVDILLDHTLADQN